MQFPSRCCGDSLLLLLLLVVPRCGAQTAGGRRGAELRSLQELLEALEQLREEQGQSDLEAEPVAGAEDGGPEWELLGDEGGSLGVPLPAPGPAQPLVPQTETLLQLLWDQDGEDRRADGAGVQPVPSPCLEEREKLNLGGAPKRFLSLRASPSSQTAPLPTEPPRGSGMEK